MLSSIDVFSIQGALLTLPLNDISDGLIVEEISGLDPVKATLVTSSFADVDGEQYHSSRRESRNITLQLGLEADYINFSVSDLRARLYQYFMPKNAVVLTFHTDDGLNINISGVVESFESPLFTKEPVVNISIMCFDPDFVDSDLVVLTGSTTPGETERTVNYAGTVDTGVNFFLTVDRALTEFTIYHTSANGSLRQLDFAGSLSAGDVLEISTISGAKGAWVTRANVRSSMLYGVSPQSSWIEFSPGTNLIRIYAEGDGVPYELKYTNRYGGL
jgi:hypothetical protein